MKIGVSDVNKYKFSQQLIDHWVEQGHEVDYSIYHETSFITDFDVVFYDFAAVNVVQLCKEKKRGKKVIVRGLDVEHYMTYHHNFDWDLIDYYIVLNPAQLRLLREKDFTCPEEKVKIIPPGVSLTKFTVKKAPPTKKAVFLGRFWIGKNHVGAIDLVHELNKLDPGWSLHLRGLGPDPRWWAKYFRYRMEEADFPIEIDGTHEEDLNAYLEDKDLMIVPSYKEAFSYAGAEAMAKDIPAVFNNWYGSKEVWPEEIIYNTPSEGAALVHRGWEPGYFRKIIEDRYDENRMFKEIDALL